MMARLKAAGPATTRALVTSSTNDSTQTASRHSVAMTGSTTASMSAVAGVTPSPTGSRASSRR